MPRKTIKKAVEPSKPAVSKSSGPKPITRKQTNTKPQASKVRARKVITPPALKSGFVPAESIKLVEDEKVNLTLSQQLQDLIWPSGAVEYSESSSLRPSPYAAVREQLQTIDWTVGVRSPAPLPTKLELSTTIYFTVKSPRPLRKGEWDSQLCHFSMFCGGRVRQRRPFLALFTSAWKEQKFRMVQGNIMPEIGKKSYRREKVIERLEGQLLNGGKVTKVRWRTKKPPKDFVYNGFGHRLKLRLWRKKSTKWLVRLIDPEFTPTFGRCVY